MSAILKKLKRDKESIRVLFLTNGRLNLYAILGEKAILCALTNKTIEEIIYFCALVLANKQLKNWRTILSEKSSLCNKVVGNFLCVSRSE